MRPMLFTILVGLSILQVQTSAVQVPEAPEQFPGQREHREPPKGYFCSASAKDAAHVCHCKRMAKATPDDPVCEESAPIAESPQCAVSLSR